MRLEWHVENSDLERLRELRRAHGRRAFVRRRVKRNVKSRGGTRLSKAKIWGVHLGCLLTTQQRSGPGSPVQRFLDAEPFPLGLSRCRSARSASRMVQQELARFGGIRWAPQTAAYAAENLYWFENGGWRGIQLWARRLRKSRGARVERQAAQYVAEHLRGFGPKQARNFWQWLGLTRFEIPLDSRMIGWLNKADFPVRLSASALSDPAYYEMVLDALQQLCRAARMYPCVFDALVFATYDKDEWVKRSRVW